jgi:membrane-bound lytic murein transglycosylase MltF
MSRSPSIGPASLPGTALLLALALVVGCGRDHTDDGDLSFDDAAALQAEVGSTAPRPELSELGTALFGPLDNNWTGDLDGMVARRYLRVLVVPTRTQYWIHDGRPIGIEYERLRTFEQWLNKRHKTDHRHLHVHLVYIPTRRDDLIPALLEGRGDIAVGMLTSTPERLEQVDFAGPFLREVSELPVTRDDEAVMESAAGLAGRVVVVRRSSSYWSHLRRLNAQLRSEGREPIRLRPASERLTDDDLLEMVATGLVDATVVDDYAARLWSSVFSDLRVHEQAAVHQGGELGWLVRKDSPTLRDEIDAFARGHGQGTRFGNSVLAKYTGDTRFTDASLSDDSMARFRGTYDTFRKYAEEYSLDPLLLVAQGYQESRLRQDARSKRGAIGIMQLMPATARAMEVGDITRLDANVHAGAKYVRRLMDVYFSEPELDELNRTLFAFAAYNAGPARVQGLRSAASRRGLDPDVWFNNVELMAAEQIGPETVSYVANIYKYYIAYTLALHAAEERDADRRKAA